MVRLCEYAAVTHFGHPDPAALSAILHALPVGVWVAKVPGGELAYANEEFIAILGMSARSDVAAGEYAQAYSILDRNGRPYPEAQLPFVRAQRERRTVVVDDIVIARSDGTRVYVRAFGRPLFDPTGALTHVVVAFTDISAQVDAEREGAIARSRLATALQHAPIILFTADRSGIITVSEGAGLVGLGYESNQLVGVNVYDLYREVPGILANIQRAMSGESFTTSTQVGPTTLESFMGPLYAEDGSLNGMIGISTDVTERLRLERQVTHTDRMTVLGRLAASVAHEINNPLAYAIESLRLARELTRELEAEAAVESPQRKRAHQLRQVLHDATEGAERVRMIARDLKSFSHPDEDTRGPVRIDAAIQTAARFVAKRTQARARVELDLQADGIVLADENRLVQIFANLILNASDALPPSSAAVNVIRVSSRRQDFTTIVEVADSGAGVAPELRALVFEPFFTTKPVGEGTGLGLHVTRNLVEALGGSIEVGAAPEGGALFTVRVPTQTGSVLEPAKPPSPSLSPTPRTRMLRVLIIDDEAMITRVFRATLEGECEVEVALSGRQALERLLAGEQYDFIFCDLMMSDIGGAQLHAELKARAPGREHELIFMTGGVYDPAVAAFLESVDNRCVGKPFDIRHEVLEAPKK